MVLPRSLRSLDTARAQIGVAMPVSVTSASKVPADAEAVVLGVRSDRLDDDTAGLDRALLDAQGFEGKRDQRALVTDGDGGVRLLIGLGEAASVDAGALRRAGAALSRAASRYTAAATTMLDQLADGTDRTAAAQALAEGVVLGAYRYTQFKEPDPATDKLAAVTVVSTGGKRLQQAVQRGVRVAEAVNLARDLVNTPGGTLTPAAFADEAERVAGGADLEVSVLDLDAIRDARLGGLLGVNRGSAQQPRLVKIAHRPKRPQGFLALVGKGITFDSGGLSLKTADGMTDMKSDMSGAAAVLAAMSLVAEIAPRLKVEAYLPLTDNMVGGDATRVGDVLTIRNGKTVEVLNTDAEGRLVLADGLSLATEAGPDAIVDLATLTGACMVALGPRTAGLMGNDEGWLDQVRSAADTAGEAVWPLPMPEHLRKSLDSEIADLRNIGNGRYGGALVAALFLREFVGEGIPWAHLDIAGPAFVAEADGETPKGGTGYGVRLLLQLFAGWTRPSSTSNGAAAKR